MEINELCRTPLGLSPDQLSALFNDFVDEEATTEQNWKEEVRRRKRKLLTRWIRDKFGASQAQGRDLDIVQHEYERAWSARGGDIYQLANGSIDRTPWIAYGRNVFASDLGATRFRQKIMIHTINHIAPSTVLEIGCGDGINLLLLACRFPDIQFTGVELTAAGVQAAQEFQAKHDTLPSGIATFAPEDLPDPQGFKNVTFLQGSADNLPFADASFDCVQTILALEQMEQIQQKALAEMARVARHWCFNIEPFADVNAGFWSKLYVSQRGYFRAKIQEYRKYGLEPQWATSDYPQELFLKTCAVLSKKLS